MTGNELRGMIINIIHPQYGRPDGKMFDCCYDAEKHSDQLISLLDTPAGIAYLKSQGWVKIPEGCRVTWKPLEEPEGVFEMTDQIKEWKCSQCGIEVSSDLKGFIARHQRWHTTKAQQIASQDEVKPDDYLLTDEELKIIAVQYANQICTSNPIKLWNDVEFVRINIKAQLAKVQPYILTGEQQAIWEEAIRAEVYKEINSGQPVDSKER